MLGMHNLQRHVVILLASILAPCATATAGSKQCFSKTLTIQEYSITVSSSPGTYSFSASSCFGQVYRIEIARNGVLIARSEEVEASWTENAWVTDLDGDGSFEVVVSTFDGMGNWGDLALYTIGEGNEINRTSLPELGKDEEIGYRGKDDFNVEDDRIVRTFPTYLTSDANCCPSGEGRRFEYRYTNGSLEVVKEREFFSFGLIAFAFIIMFACVGLSPQLERRGLLTGEIAVMVLALVASAYCIAAGIHLHDGWQEMMAVSDENNEFSREGATHVRRGGLLLLALRYWPYVLMGLGAYVAYNSLAILRLLLKQRRRLETAKAVTSY